MLSHVDFQLYPQLVMAPNMAGPNGPNLAQYAIRRFFRHTIYLLIHLVQLIPTKSDSHRVYEFTDPKQHTHTCRSDDESGNEFEIGQHHHHNVSDIIDYVGDEMDDSGDHDLEQQQQQHHDDQQQQQLIQEYEDPIEEDGGMCAEDDLVHEMTAEEVAAAAMLDEGEFRDDVTEDMTEEVGGNEELDDSQAEWQEVIRYEHF